ncbi:hypothetical protein VNO78_06335 [Psophocarpus tetragonolobus]|uniref:TIR domain-containing protein n=1 Tax=Psophocarpus tetragonolobus TaxID=3891 RepID=A0AAN9STG5_PSOTE
MASNAINQCTSSSSHLIRTYDVFVSFRGETRNNFTGFLFQALEKRGIDAYKDDKDIRKGASIAPELLQAIEGSRVFIVIFSKDYASSTWCLRELAHVCKCIQTSPRPVLPIFYDVDPSDVRKQGKHYEEAFVRHEERFREDKEMIEEVKRWREVMTQVANLSGWDIQNKQQYAQIEEIVQEITKILGSKFSTIPNDNLHLHNLKSLDLSFSKNLIELPDFGDALNLEELYLQGCKQLKQIHPSIGHLKKLLYVYLVGCQSLTNIPHIGGAINLRDLYLQGCVKLRFVDPSIGLLTKLSHLNLKNCQNLEGLPKSILGLYSLEYLNLSCCLKLQLLDEPRDETHSVSCLWPSFAIFPRMVKLDLSCCNLVQIPEAVANLCCLERLDLSGNSFATLPSLKDLSKLYCLKLQHCKNLTCLPELPSRVGFESSNDCVESNVGLYIFNCPKLVERESHMNIGFSWMLQLTQAFHKDGYSTTESIIPGSKMPERFNNLEESTDNYISIDTSPIMNDNKWIGIVFCVIFKVPYKRDLAIGPSLEERYSRGFLEIPVNFYGNPELVLDKSDHVWLFFFNQKRFMYEWGQSYGGSSKCNIKIHDGLGFNVQVKNYGYFWVYEQDLQLSNPVPRKRKFLAIEQNEGRISAK